MTTDLDKKAEATFKKKPCPYGVKNCLECQHIPPFHFIGGERLLFDDWQNNLDIRGKDAFKSGYAEAQKVELTKLVDAYEADVKKDLNRDDLFSPNENVFFLRAFLRDYLRQPPKQEAE